MAKPPKEPQVHVQVSAEPAADLLELLERVEAAEGALAGIDMDAVSAALASAGAAAEQAVERHVAELAKLSGAMSAAVERLDRLEVEHAVQAEQLQSALRRLSALEVGSPVEIRSLTRAEISAITAEDPAHEFEVLADWRSRSTPHRYRKGEILRADLVEHVGDLVASGLCIGTADPSRAESLDQIRAKARADQRARTKAARAETAAQAVEAAQAAVKALAEVG